MQQNRTRFGPVDCGTVREINLDLTHNFAPHGAAANLARGCVLWLTLCFAATRKVHRLPIHAVAFWGGRGGGTWPGTALRHTDVRGVNCRSWVVGSAVFLPDWGGSIG